MSFILEKAIKYIKNQVLTLFLDVFYNSINMLFGKSYILVQSNRVSGKFGEDLAVKHLILQGYTILNRNLWIGVGEIDIVAKRGETLYFVEVKTSKSYIRPEEHLTRVKLKKFNSSIKTYLYKNNIQEGIDYKTIAILIDLNNNDIEMVEL